MDVQNINSHCVNGYHSQNMDIFLGPPQHPSTWSTLIIIWHFNCTRTRNHYHSNTGLVAICSFSPSCGVFSSLGLPYREVSQCYREVSPCYREGKIFGYWKLWHFQNCANLFFSKVNSSRFTRELVYTVQHKDRKVSSLKNKLSSCIHSSNRSAASMDRMITTLKTHLH